jgi:prepilin-type processing-associated H-X9-DG protein
VIQAGEYTVESFTDGMSIDYSTVTGAVGQKGHEFSDILPLHAQKGKETGGYANVLFADGHVATVHDAGGLNDEPDGFIGPYKNTSGAFEINTTAFKEMRNRVWYGRLRPKALPGGGSVE